MFPVEAQHIPASAAEAPLRTVLPTTKGRYAYSCRVATLPRFQESSAVKLCYTTVGLYFGEQFPAFAAGVAGSTAGRQALGFQAALETGTW